MKSNSSPEQNSNAFWKAQHKMIQTQQGLPCKAHRYERRKTREQLRHTLSLLEEECLVELSELRHGLPVVPLGGSMSS